MKYQVEGKEWTVTQLLRAKRIIKVNTVKGKFDIRTDSGTTREMPFETVRQAKNIYQKWLRQHMNNALELNENGEDGILYLQSVLTETELRHLKERIELDLQLANNGHKRIPLQYEHMFTEEAIKIQEVLPK